MKSGDDGYHMIDGILVDVESLLKLKHYCDPTLCRNGRYCCAQYEITVDKADIKRAVGLMPDAAKFAPEVGEGFELGDRVPAVIVIRMLQGFRQNVDGIAVIHGASELPKIGRPAFDVQ